MSILTLLHRIAISIAIIVTFGVLVHDTRFDKIVKIATVPAAAIASALGAHGLDFGGHAHTHVERVSLNNVLSSMPRTQPRDDNRRHYLSKNLSRTDDFFGGSRVMWPTI